MGGREREKKKKFADETVCWDGQHIEDIVDDEMELTFFLSKRKKNRSEKVGRKKKGGGGVVVINSRLRNVVGLLFCFRRLFPTSTGQSRYGKMVKKKTLATRVAFRSLENKYFQTLFFYFSLNEEEMLIYWTGEEPRRHKHDFLFASFISLLCSVLFLIIKSK